MAKKALELSQRECKEEEKRHIGYYLIDDGKTELTEKVRGQRVKKLSNRNKMMIFGGMQILIAGLIAWGEGWIWHQKVDANFISSILLAILTFCISVQSVKLIGQYLLGKLIKPRRIPKLDFQNGVPKEYATFIVIPTILNQEKKVEEFFKKLEVFYLANKSENLYFAL